MDTGKVTWFGKEGHLHLQMRRFPAGKEVTCRLDDITPPERRRHRDLLLVKRSDGALINIGSLVPEDVAVKAIKECSSVVDNYSGFYVHLPNGFGLVDNPKTNQLNVVAAEEVAAAVTPVPSAVATALFEGESREAEAELMVGIAEMAAESVPAEPTPAEQPEHEPEETESDWNAKEEARGRKGKKRRGEKAKGDLASDLLGE